MTNPHAFLLDVFLVAQAGLIPLGRAGAGEPDAELGRTQGRAGSPEGVDRQVRRRNVHERDSDGKVVGREAEATRADYTQM